MTEKHTNNIDDIFKNSIESLETEPSEGFWIKASEDALFKSNLAKRSELNKWKTAAYIFGAAVIALAAYLIYSQEEMSGIKKQLIILQEKTAFQSTPQQVITTNAQATKPTEIVISPIIQHTVKSQSSVNITSVAPVIAFKEKKNDAPKQSVGNSFNKYISIPAQKSSQRSSNIGNNSTEVSSSLPISTSEKTNELLVTKPAYLPAPEGVNIIEPASISINQANSVPSADKKSIWSKFSASIFYSPYLSDEYFENESSDNTTINNVMTNEEESNPYMVGLRLGYDISSHWSVITGLYYYNYKVNINPVTIYAQQEQNGEVGYSLQTSLGNVNCQYNGTPRIGDAMKINGTATARYFSIPLQVKYNFINNHKIGFYITGGATVNIVSYSKMTLHWQDFKWEQGDELEGIQNAKSIYGSFYAAPGVSYRFYKGFSLYLEPSVLGSPSFFGKGTSSNPSPVFVGLGGGLTYHF